MPQSLVQVDAFSDRSFAGNPAAVCILPAAATAAWMQAVAAEMNLSETAFLHPAEGGYQLRWFTPAAEVDLCGHATLASAHTLWSEGHLSPNQTIQFQTRSGQLSATRQGDWIRLNFPASPVQPVEPPAALAAGLGNLPLHFTGLASKNYLVELASAAAVRQLTPDFGQLRALPVDGVIVTSPADAAGVDFVSRYFAPAVGIDEDPVTGSAHCALGPYWQQKLGKSSFLAHQVSARGGVIKVDCQSDRVYLSGQAVTVLRGQLADEPEWA